MGTSGKLKDYYILYKCYKRGQRIPYTGDKLASFPSYLSLEGVKSRMHTLLMKEFKCESVEIDYLNVFIMGG